jgi:hypothetical protein
MLALFHDPAEALDFYSTYPTNLNESTNSFARAFAQGQVLGKLAEDRIQKVAESVGTPAVATDMLNIVRAFGRDKVNYWGISCVL